MLSHTAFWEPEEVLLEVGQEGQKTLPRECKSIVSLLIRGAIPSLGIPWVISIERLCISLAKICQTWGLWCNRSFRNLVWFWIKLELALEKCGPTDLQTCIINYTPVVRKLEHISISYFITFRECYNNYIQSIQSMT